MSRKTVRVATFVLCLLFAGFVLGTGLFGYLPGIRQLAVCTAFALIITILAKPLAGWQGRFGKAAMAIDLALIVIVLAACANAYVKYLTFVTQHLGTTTLDQVMAILLTLTVLELSRRTIGRIFAGIAVVLLFYLWLGAYIPGYLGHTGVPLTYIWVELYQTLEGLWGTLTSTVATTIAPFMILAGLLIYSGGGQTFIDLAIALAGRMTGGPALVSVIGSGLFGTINGSGIVNAASIGNFTIPLMKKLGYKPAFAAGVESISPTGGFIMPPVMGAGAFIMAEMIGIPYVKICIYATLPAILFYIAVFLGVYFEAVKSNLRPVPSEMIPSLRSCLTYRRIIPLVVPVVVLLVLLLGGWSAGYAATLSCLSALVILLLLDFSPSRMKERLVLSAKALDSGGMSLALLIPMMICAGIIIMSINVSGLGFKVSTSIIGVGGEMLWAALILAAMVAIVLGMGLPVVCAYVIAAATAVPALSGLGVSLLNAHMFTYYFAMLAGITPPVCMVVFVTAAIAEANWLETAWVAIRLGIVSYFVPFAFIYNPAVMLNGTPIQIAIAAVSCTVASMAVAASIWKYAPGIGRIPLVARVLLFPAGIALMIAPYGNLYYGLAVAVLLVALSMSWFTSRRTKPVAA